MEFNENEFFRHMTLRICGSLDLETALQRSFDYLRNVIPLDMMSLHFYDANLGAMHTVAEISGSGANSTDIVAPLDKAGRASFTEPDVPNVRIVNYPETDPVIKKLLAAMKVPKKSSALVMRLVIENKRIGSLVLTAGGNGRYTEDHARLFSLLNEPYAVAVANALTHEEVIRLKDMMSDDNKYLRQELLSMSADEIIGSDFGLKQVMEMVRKVAPLESPVLLLGETGVGKGVLAGAIHHLSSRSKGPFITVNSGAIPETLIDSELFGYEKGAFTGAVEQRRGRFERANGGTIFLDEIGELPLQAQVRMLRVLQEKVIERVGGSKPIPVDIRIIAATHRNLDEMVRAGRFREDLLFRINVFPVRIPPLRERKEDIPSLVHYFINKKSLELKLPELPDLSPGAINRLTGYDWPGNVRELENVIEREIILNRKGPLNFSNISGQDSRVYQPAAGPGMDSLTLNEISIHHIIRALEKTGGKIHGANGAAGLLGINPSTLRSRMKKLGIGFGKNYK
ncbi:MAG: sigma 54-interacting transcriptional regulator [Syntrophaceae bacterium]